IISQRPVESDKLYQVFQAVLNLYGFTIVKRDSVSFIIPSTDGRARSPIVNYGDITGDKLDLHITQIIPMKYYPVETISQILTPYLSKAGQISFDSRSNTIFLSDFGANIKKMLEIVKSIDQPSPPGKESLRVFKLQNANAEDVAKTLNEILAKKRVQPTRPGQQIIQPAVVAVKATNSLIAYAESDDFSNIESLIKELDVMTNQVLIEALIAEVSYKKEQDIGIQWKTVQDFDHNKYTGSAETKFGIETASNGLLIGFTNTKSLIDHVKIALSGKDTQFNILSTPQIMTADNTEATINISENTPYLKETRFTTTTGGSGTDTIRSYDYKDVGIILKITPQISQDKYVRLKLHQEVTKVVTENTEGALTTAKREADTTLIVPNNQTIVLGGLIRNDTESTTNKTPFLGDIPGLGKLFKRESKGSVKTNLLIFITPHIITNFEEAERIKKEKEKVLQDDKKK
ncbi:MAG: secretin N-terminal domain-containing protein, partial [Candidatus Ratteibacteria bacterium]